jgi:hypothetical protein
VITRIRHPEQHRRAKIAGEIVRNLLITEGTLLDRGKPFLLACPFIVLDGISVRLFASFRLDLP